MPKKRVPKKNTEPRITGIERPEPRIKGIDFVVSCSEEGDCGRKPSEDSSVVGHSRRVVLHVEDTLGMSRRDCGRKPSEDSSGWHVPTCSLSPSVLAHGEGGRWHHAVSGRGTASRETKNAIIVAVRAAGWKTRPW